MSVGGRRERAEPPGHPPPPPPSRPVAQRAGPAGSRRDWPRGEHPRERPHAPAPSLRPVPPSLPPPPWPAEPRAGSTGSLLASRGLSSPERVGACAGQKRTLREPSRDTLVSAPRLSAASPACRRVAGSSSEKVSSLA